MLGLIKQYLANTETKNLQFTPTPNTENLLNRILLGQYLNNLIVWYDPTLQNIVDEGYRGNAMVYSIIRKISDKAKVAELQVFKATSNQKKYKSFKYHVDDIVRSQGRVFKKKELELVEGNDDVHILIQRPNFRQSTSEFIDDCCTWWNTSGEIFIYGVGPEVGQRAGKYSEMYVLPSHLMEIIQGDMFNPIVGYKMAIGDQMIVFPAEDILHIKSFNPDWDIQGSQLRGQAPLLAGLKFLKKNNSGVQAGANSNENQGAKGLVSPSITNPEMYLDAVQMEEFRQGIDKRLNGTDNISKIIASGMPLQYTQIGLSPVALDLIAGLDYDDKKLCGLWGINPVIFEPTATQANLMHAQKALVTDVVMPFLNMLEQKLGEWINAKFKTDYVLDFDVTSYPELAPDVEKIINTYGKSIAFTPNELREMVGFDNSEYPGLDDHWITSSMVTVKEAAINPDFSDFQA
jgi:HK97 family phage portal protein